MRYHEHDKEGWPRGEAATAQNFMNGSESQRNGGPNPPPSTNAKGRAEAIPASRLRIDGAWEGKSDWSASTGRANPKRQRKRPTS